MRTTNPTKSPPIDFYSTAWGRKYDLNRETAAEAIVAQAVDTIDFPKVIESAYADGIRLFVEVGPGSSCTRLIDEILGDRIHFARSATPVTGSPVGTFIELLAALISERVPVDLTLLYGGAGDISEQALGNNGVREIVKKTGGAAFEIPAPPSGWQISIKSQIQPVAVTLPQADQELTLVTIQKASPDLAERQFTSTLQDNRERTIDRNHVTNDVLISSDRRPVQNRLLADIENFLPDDSKATFIMTQMDEMLDARSKAHEAYLRVSSEAQRIMAEQLALLAELPNEPEGHIHQARAYIEPADTSNRICSADIDP
jgi:acyl transferase domain-containing protein